MNKAQGLTIIAALVLAGSLYFLGRTSPHDGEKTSQPISEPGERLSIDSLLFHAKEILSLEQRTRIELLEQSVTRGDVKSQRLEIYHQLAHFWKDTVGIFQIYCWYEAEAARLENSEKSLTFAAHQFLDDLRSNSNLQIRKWEAFQARDLFERSLKINDKNDSSIVGLGACYIFGNIAENPMEGILKVRQVAEKDSTNIFAQLVLGHGSVLSSQYDRATDRFQRVHRLQPENLEAIMMLAEVYERKADKPSAITWYKQAIPLVENPDLKSELENRIKELSK